MANATATPQRAIARITIMLFPPILTSIIRTAATRRVAALELFGFASRQCQHYNDSEKLLLGEETDVMRFSIAAGMAAALMVAPAFGHHSGAMFDRDQTTVIEGTIEDWQWTNPHCWLQVLVPDENGRPVEWVVEFGSPSQMARGGIRYNTFAAGEKITLGIHPLKNGRPGGVYSYAILADGQTLGDAPEQ